MNPALPCFLIALLCLAAAVLLDTGWHLHTAARATVRDLRLCFGRRQDEYPIRSGWVDTSVIDRRHRDAARRRLCSRLLHAALLAVLLTLCVRAARPLLTAPVAESLLAWMFN